MSPKVITPCGVQAASATSLPACGTPCAGGDLCLEAPANALGYSWKHFIGGHLGRLGTRDDVTLHQQYMADVQAGAQPVTWVALAVELQRDWAREETVADVIEIVLTERLLKA